MPAKKVKLYRVQFLITKPAKKNEKVKGLSHVFFISAYNEDSIREFVMGFLNNVRIENNNDHEIYLKTMNIKLQRCTGTVNLAVKN